MLANAAPDCTAPGHYRPALAVPMEPVMSLLRPSSIAIASATGLILINIGCGTSTMKFKYNAEKRSCEDSSGNPGHNMGELAECGEIKSDSTSFKNADRRGKSLKGLRVEDSFLNGVNFDDADLTDAYFQVVNFSGATFNRATLYSAVFAVNPDDFPEYGVDLQGALVDGDTIFPNRPLDKLVSSGIIFKGKEKFGSWSFSDSDKKPLNWILSDTLSHEEQAIIGGDLSALPRYKVNAEEILPAH